MKKRVDQLKELINKLKSTDRGKALLFFGGYLIFFIIIFIVINTADRIQMTASDFENGNLIKFNVNNIKDNNYSFKYTITVDVTDYIFEGERYNDYDKYKFNTLIYFMDNSNKNVFKQ